MAPAADGGDAGSWLDGMVRLVEMPRFDDADGSLVPFEFDRLPFSPHRMFVVSSVPVDTVRGRHALLEQQQLLVCLAGRIDVEVRWLHLEAFVTLDQADVGLLINPGVWSSQRFIADASMLLGLSSGSYDPDGYETKVPGRDG